MIISKEEIEEDYNRVKSEFHNEDSSGVAARISREIRGHEKLSGEIFSFLIQAFKGKARNDKKTPLVFHSIYLTRLAYLCGERGEDALLTIALHDVLEDTEVDEEILMKQGFMKGKEHLLQNLKTLSENTNLSREPDGENLPPRYVEHIGRIVGSPKEVINTEILDRFSDLMDLEYITELPEEEKKLRLKSKIIKVRGFVENITRNRDDFNQNAKALFEAKAKEIENKWEISVKIPIIN